MGIVDVATKVISSLRALQQRWSATDLTIRMLISHITIMKAALQQIEAWISSSLEPAPQHHQLVMDLDVALDSCQLLLLFMDEHISRLEWTDNGKMTFDSKVRAMLEDRSVTDCLNHLNNQTMALNLLLTALHWSVPPRNPPRNSACYRSATFRPES